MATGKGKRHGGILYGLLLVMPWALILGGIVLLAYPVYTDWMHAKAAEESISEVMNVYDDMNDPERLENLRQAQAYNARLAGQDYEEPKGGIWDYRIQLTYRGTPASMMSWVDIPSIQTRLPIFHYATDDVLSSGVGHLEWSALPVGGDGTRCVISAHSGMQDTRMFDDIRELKEGDTFVLWSLSEPYAYRVCDIQVILPNNLEALKPESGRDLCTLVTCTPFGVNTHRLCVTGERCEYVEAETKQTDGVKPYVNRRTTPLLIGMTILLALVVLLVVLAVVRRRRKKRKALLDGNKDA